MKTSRIVLGHFHTSGDLVVSDPCYVTKHTEWSPDESGDIFRAKRIADAKVFEPHNEGGEELEVEPGLWVALVDRTRNELHSLVILRVGRRLEQYLTDGKLNWQHEFDVGVDSGKFGFFDTHAASKEWDYMALIETEEDQMYEYGPVVRHDDGGYPIYVLFDGQADIVGIKLAVIDEE